MPKPLPKTAPRPIGIDLFAGAGGLSLGFEQAGFDVVAAVEIDPIHCCVHKFNFPNCAVIPKSVVGLTGKEIRSKAGIGSATVDVVFGGAPCQGFSMIGHRVIDDPRNALVKEFVRIVEELNPKHFVFENVKGITIGNHRKLLDEIIEEFHGIGYKVAEPWKVLNANQYSVPQDRQRLILLGSRRGCPIISYPAPTVTPAGRAKQSSIPVGPSCRDALSDLPNAESYESLWMTDAVRFRPKKNKSDYAKEMSCESEGAWHFGVKRRWDPAILTSSMRTEHTEISRMRFARTSGGLVEPISRLFKLPADGIANTLRAGTDAARGAFTSPRPIHYAYPRLITVREMARLHGYPDWFRFHVTKWHGARQIGNSVPPPLARAVASEVMRALGRVPSICSTEIDLGEIKLLNMDMSEACGYWGVPSPIGRRDRKSGNKKRKQMSTLLASAG